MAKVDKLLEKWLNNTPKDEPKDKVLAIIERFFPSQYEQKSGSHIIIQDDLLKNIPEYGPIGEFGVVVSGGQKVKGYYLKRLVKIINLLKELGKWKET